MVKLNWNIDNKKIPINLWTVKFTEDNKYIKIKTIKLTKKLNIKNIYHCGPIINNGFPSSFPKKK